MRFRIESTLGWMMLGGLGGQLTGTYRPELFAAQDRLVLGGRTPGKGLAMGRRDGMSSSVLDKMPEAQRRFLDDDPSLTEKAKRLAAMIDGAAARTIDLDAEAVQLALAALGDTMARTARDWGVSAAEVDAILTRALQAEAEAKDQ